MVSAGPRRKLSRHCLLVDVRIGHLSCGIRRNAGVLCDVNVNADMELDSELESGPGRYQGIKSFNIGVSIYSFGILGEGDPNRLTMEAG